MQNALNRITSLTALVVGDVMIDAYLWGTVERMSPEAPVPVVLMSGRDERAGGAANVARNIISMGAKVHMASVVGNDHNGELLKSLLQEREINTGAIVIEDGRPTTVKTRVINKSANSEHMLRVDEETSEQIKSDTQNQLQTEIEKVLESEQIDLIVIEDYDKGVMSEGLANFLIEQGRERGIMVAVDPKLRNFNFYRGVDLFKPNLKELREGLQTQADSTSRDSMIAAVESLHSELNPRMTLTTLGSEGMWTHSPENGCVHHHEKGLDRDVIDVSGAGDTVIAVASLMLAAGSSPQDATKAANICGGLVCEESGVVMIDRESLIKELSSNG